MERLSKIMAARGLCSRREADEFIRRGWVAVDGEKVTVLGTKIHPQQKISLAPEARTQIQGSVTILINKPVGYVSAQAEKGYPAAVQLITFENQYAPEHAARRFHPSHCRGLAPAGRLDIDSQGLLVLTQNGQIARQLIHSGSRIEKEYLVWIQGTVTVSRLQLLRHGLALDGKILLPAVVSPFDGNMLKMILREGRKRQIRRMCQLVGLQVTKLKRTRIGRVHLGGLPLGKWRYLSKHEVF
ncbi:rRNA pseudouridine synthase [candidate division FCPU426 bacterium]|nr:rRNA pseudouridine synthase [candidate division FCPU426 bacterium]